MLTKKMVCTSYTYNEPYAKQVISVFEMVQKYGIEVNFMKVGYIRVSTKEQNLDRQKEQMDELKIEKVFEEQASGKDIQNRPKFNQLMSYIRQGDTLVVTSLDRLGRNYEDIKEIINTLNKKKIRLMVIDAPFLNFHTGNDLLDRTMSDMFLSLLSYIAHIERENIRERQRQGIELAKARGVYKGGQRVYSSNSNNLQKRALYQLVLKLYQEEVPIRGIARQTGVSRNTVYRIIREENEK